MSYCRWSDGDLYIYDDVRGYLCCTSCLFEERGPSGFSADFTTPSRRTMAAHVRAHIAAGHDADEDVAKELEEEADSLGDDVASERHGEEPERGPRT